MMYSNLESNVSSEIEEAVLQSSLEADTFIYRKEGCNVLLNLFVVINKDRDIYSTVSVVKVGEDYVLINRLMTILHNYGITYRIDSDKPKELRLKDKVCFLYEIKNTISGVVKDVNYSTRFDLDFVLQGQGDGSTILDLMTKTTACFTHRYMLGHLNTLVGILRDLPVEERDEELKKRLLEAFLNFNVGTYTTCMMQI